MKKNIIKKNKIILSLIFPSYNEEKNLKLLLTAFKNLIKNRKIEIIVEKTSKIKFLTFFFFIIIYNNPNFISIF